MTYLFQMSHSDRNEVLLNFQDEQVASTRSERAAAV